MLETKLKTLFDYQRLKNTDLQSVIDEVLERYAQNEPRRLSDDDLALAAGGVGIPEEKEDREPEL